MECFADSQVKRIQPTGTKLRNQMKLDNYVSIGWWLVGGKNSKVSGDCSECVGVSVHYIAMVLSM